MKPARIFLTTLASLAACAALAQQGATPVPPDEEDGPEVEEEWDFDKGRGADPAMLERLNLLVPEGRSHEGLRYPVYADDSVKDGPMLEAEFKSQKVTRLDESHLEFRGAVYSTFGDAKFPDTATRAISLQDAIYDLRQDLIFSDEPVRIDDRGGSIRSGGILHDRTTGITIFTGGVELFLNEQPAPKVEAPATTPSPP